eukprot:40521-Eustigmatos_ZCMA.PRE.1
MRRHQCSANKDITMSVSLESCQTPDCEETLHYAPSEVSPPNLNDLTRGMRRSCCTCPATHISLSAERVA